MFAWSGLFVNIQHDIRIPGRNHEIATIKAA